MLASFSPFVPLRSRDRELCTFMFLGVVMNYYSAGICNCGMPFKVVFGDTKSDGYPMIPLVMINDAFIAGGLLAKL